MLTRMLWPGEDRDAPSLRHPFLEQLDAFAHEIQRQICHSREVPARPGEALYEFAVDRIAAEAEHDSAGGLEGLYRVHHEFLRDDDLGLGCNELACYSIHVFPTPRPIEADAEIAALNPSEVA